MSFSENSQHLKDFLFLLNLRLGKNKWESVLIQRLLSKRLWHHAVKDIVYLQIHLETNCVHRNFVFWAVVII